MDIEPKTSFVEYHTHQPALLQEEVITDRCGFVYERSLREVRAVHTWLLYADNCNTVTVTVAVAVKYR